MGVLTIYLDKVTNLTDTDFVGRADPYITFYLEKDKLLFDKGYGKQASTKKNNQLNPVYGETFAFSQLDSMKNMVLYIKIMDDDQGLDDKLGKAKLELEDLGLNETPKDMEISVDNKQAKIYLKLSYTK
jgi:Ca2+-dependent lipid-binding protein